MTSDLNKFFSPSLNSKTLLGKNSDVNTAPLASQPPTKNDLTEKTNNPKESELKEISYQEI